MKTIALTNWLPRVPADLLVSKPTEDAYAERYYVTVASRQGRELVVERCAINASFVSYLNDTVNYVSATTLRHLQVDVDAAVTRLRAKLRDRKANAAHEKRVAAEKAKADARARQKKS